MTAKTSLILTAIVSRSIHWLLEPDTPLIFALDNPPGWSLLNPMLEADRLTIDKSTLCIEDGRYFVSTKKIAFVIQRASTTDADMASIFLRRLRYATGQASIPLVIDCKAYFTIDELSSRKPGNQPAFGQAVLRNYLKRVAVTPESVRDAGVDRSDRDCPVYSEILLDAIHATEEGDFKKAILYSAIATEAMAATILANEYEHLRTSEGQQAHLRIAVSTASRRQAEDPIYIALTERRDRFSYKLHQIPLYLLNRSLLADDKALYDKAIDLHNSRSALVHVTSRPSRMALTNEGARSAIDTATRVFSWFGAPGRYEMPD